MSYNIMSKNASFKGDISGTIENQVNDWDNQTIGGDKTFTNAITSSADVMLSGSGKVSASFFFGDGTNLSGVATSAAGSDREVQFNDGGTNFGASANFKFTAANEVQVAGQISASLGVSGSEFHGDGSNLTNVTASFVTASNVVGILDAPQINIGSGLEDSSNAIQINLSSSTSGLSIDSDGLQLDVFTLGLQGSYSSGDSVVVQSGANSPKKIVFSTIANGIAVQASNVSSTSGKLDNSTMPTNISITSLTASSHVSASTFHGDGSALEGVTATPTPAGSNTQIQFNNDGALAADADLTFLTGSDTLATTIVSASSHVSASEFAGAIGTLIDSEGNFSGNNAFFAEITASSIISSSADIFGAAFIGDGTQLSGVPLGQSNAASIVFIDNETNKTITTNSGFTFNGTHAVNTGGGFKGTILSASSDVQVGGHITGSGDIRLFNSGSVITDGNISLGGDSQITFDDGVGNTSGILQGGTNQLTIEAHNTLTIKNDNFFIIKDENGDNRFSADVRQSAAVPKITLTDLAISSSTFISASSIHLAGTGSSIISSGGNTFLDNNGNIFTGGITMQDGAGVTLNFNDNEISGSGHVSASAFFGDGSGLTGIDIPTTFEDHIKTSSYFQFNGATFWIPLAGNNPGARNQLDNVTLVRWGGIHYVTPASGSLKRFKMIAINSADGLYTTPTKFDIILTLSKNDTTTSAASATGAPHGHITASANTYVVASGSYGLVWDIPIAGNSEFSGSNTFDPGDVLKMTNRFATIGGPGGSNNYDTQMTITFELSGSDV